VRVDKQSILNRLFELIPYGAGLLRETAPEVEYLFSLQVHGPADQPVVYRDGVEWLRSPQNGNLNDLLRIIAVGMKASVTENAPDHLFVHAGVVGWHDRAIVIPGQSESGKTTLVEQLVGQGAVYYSDDYAVLDREGMVHPFAQALRRRVRGRSDRDLRTPEELGGAAGHLPLPIGLVVACPYVRGASWAPRQISLAEGLAVLLDNTRAAYRDPERVLGVLQRATGGSGFLAGPRGEAVIAAREILHAAG
jgi:hypothetical protein